MFFRVLLLLLPVCCFCQSQFRFDHFSIKNGLSQNTVNCVLKDKEGYYWIGTQDGLNRYDGYSVKFFRHDKDDSTTISDNFILTIQEDNYGNFWIGTRNGFNHFDKKSGKFTKIISNEKERDDFHASVWSTSIDNEGNILYSNAFSQVIKIGKEDSKAPPFVPQIIADSSVFFRTSAKTYCLVNPFNAKIMSFGSDHSKKWEVTDTTLGTINTILENEKGGILIGSSNGLFLSPGPDQKILPIQILQGKNINKILFDTRQNIWVGTSSGMYVYSDGDLSAMPILLTHSAEDAHSIASNSIQGLYEDPEGLIWAGTSEGGVSIYDPQKKVFKVINHTSPVSLSANSIWGIYQDNNELWVGTNSGLNHLTFKGSAMAEIYSHKNKLLAQEVFEMTGFYPNSIGGNSITSIEKDKAGNLWFASNNNGISIYNPFKKNWKQFNTKNSSLKSDHIFHLLCASDGKMWISTLAGFYYYDPATTIFRPFLSVSHPGGTFPSGYIISIFEDKEKTIWVGSTVGVYHLKSNGEAIALYRSEVNKPSSLSYNMVTSFYQDRKGRLWISTLGGGINLFDPKTKSFRAFTQKDGLANDVTYKILEDKNGKLWISSNTGISCFDPENKTFSNYNTKDGIASNEFSQNSGLVNEAGEILFGSPEGLVVFNPTELKNSKTEIPLLITSLKVNYELVNFSTGNSVNLHYGDKTVTFEFTAPDFRNQEKIQYAFQLEGFDNRWHAVPASNRIASFTNLPFGNYIFKVRVRNGNGPWQERQLSVPLNVIPPFWLRTGFILLEVLAALLMIVLLVRYYAQRKLRKQLQAVEMQQKIHLEKELISRDLHDNVGAHLTYIITSLDNISHKMERGEKEVSQDKIESLSDFSRSTMQQLRESIWAINKKNITLEELKDKISEYSGKMASAGNMTFHVEFNSTQEYFLKPSHAINIYRVVQEAINNSVKHSEAKALVVNISKNGGEYVSIDVKDNGKGMNPQLNSNGYGLRNMQDRVKDLGGEIDIHSNEQGTSVKFTIPV